jgi:CubicO group peptidase (beta-lactamase class C family)
VNPFKGARVWLRRLSSSVALSATAAFFPAVAEDGASGLVGAEARLERSFNGVILASRGDAIVYRRAFGVADEGREGERRRFRIGSISKTFTAAIAIDLAAAGRLSLEDPLSTYVRGVENGERMTLRMLITHHSGLGDFSQREWKRLLLGAAPLTRENIITMIAAKKLRSSPGEKFAYSNAGYLLLALAMETATGRTFEELLQEFLDRQGLGDTGFSARDGEISNLAPGHAPNGELDGADYDYTAIAAAGGLFSTAADLAQWCRAQSRVDSLLGWRSGERFGRASFWHPGNTNDYSALLVRFPDIDGCYVVLSNVGRKAPPKDVIRTLPAHFFGAESSGRALE